MPDVLGGIQAPEVPTQTAAVSTPVAKYLDQDGVRLWFQ